jgi:hypothetical protein
VATDRNFDDEMERWFLLTMKVCLGLIMATSVLLVAWLVWALFMLVTS